MGSMSVLHWLVVLFIYLIIYMIIGFPVAHILRRMGYSRWWSVLSIVPVANLLGLWLLAFIDWPITRNQVTDRLRR